MKNYLDTWGICNKCLAEIHIIEQLTSLPHNFGKIVNLEEEKWACHTAHVCLTKIRKSVYGPDRHVKKP